MRHLEKHEIFRIEVIKEVEGLSFKLGDIYEVVVTFIGRYNKECAIPINLNFQE